VAKDVAVGDAVLQEIGERRLIAEVLGARYSDIRNWGDDAALVGHVDPNEPWVVATTDPCPPPMAAALGFEDWFYTGWLLATINLSDLAAAGARPTGLLSSLILPADTRLRDFIRLLDGLDECCGVAGTKVIGGNLKEAAEVSLSGTAIGVCEQPPLSRHGAQVGDSLWIVGDVGLFWAGVLGVRAGLIPQDSGHPLLQNVLRPAPKTDLMAEFARRGVVNASIDTSDGLYPALAQLAEASDVGVIIAPEQIPYEPSVLEIATQLALDPLRLALGWGDWQVVVAVDPARDSEVVAVADGRPLSRIGSVGGEGGVRATLGGRERLISPLDSERFVPDSWFSAGLEGYVSALTEGPLYLT
jgi:thiamine-monophosphate kinase